MTTDADAAYLGGFFFSVKFETLPPGQARQEPLAFRTGYKAEGSAGKCSANVYITPSHDTEIDLGSDC